MTIAPESVTYIARRASPTARRTPDIAMPSPIGTLAGMVMARKFEATGKACPCACRTLTRPQSRNVNISVATAAEMNPVMVSAEAASRRPRGRSPAPSARDTVADTAIVRPMLIAIAKNVARPT